MSLPRMSLLSTGNTTAWWSGSALEVTKTACVGRIHVQLSVQLDEDKSTLIACPGLHQGLQILLHLRDPLHQVALYTHSLLIKSNLQLVHSFQLKLNMFLSQLAVLCTLPFLAFGMKKRDVSSTSLNFALYGYGPGFGGLPLFYADGK